jgi:protein-L-isoaspartate(D-aspartate) O-methyltransferase
MDFATARINMVENQVRTNKVTDERLLEAMAEVPREQFVPKALRGIAYVDDDIDIGGGRFLIEPMIFARLVQAALIQPGDVVLDIGCGPGYTSAVLARLASTVVALESDPELAAKAAAALVELKVDNAVVVPTDAAQGYPPQAPYQVIVFGGAVAEIPQSICAQLADGGRLVAVVADGGTGRMGKAMLVTRAGDSFGRRVIFDAAIPFLPGFEPKPVFNF